MELKMYELVALMAKGKIKNGAKLYITDKMLDEVEEYVYKEVKTDYFNNSYFVNKYNTKLDGLYFSDINYLNESVSIINPNEIKYYIRVNTAGLAERKSYLNYTDYPDGYELSLGVKNKGLFIQTTFTMSEMEEYKEVREFLADMEGKYELIEAESPQQKKDEEKEEVELGEGFKSDMEELFTTDILDMFTTDILDISGGEENEVD